MANFVLKFPIRGINKSRVPDEQPEATSPGLNNMRAFDIADDRVRGGQRPGMAKRYAEVVSQFTLGGPVVAMCEVSVTEL
ncbi:hypothetical protein LCGC14_1479230 [marine sediment metagenome]|uniref:Uncharacterized protein n=1 Tax=marine sediment metagenome TaxID=412755 RepID=A0A0F9JA10_9ZZZZ